MQKINIFLMVMVSLLISSATNAETVCLQNIPNIADQTCTTTYSTGTTTTTSNLISQTFNDGSWNGTMFPDSSDIQENLYLTGKDNKYAETTINSSDLMTINELRQGFISNFNADIRWWNKWDSTVTMTQTALSGNGDSTTQTLLLTDTTNANYQFNNYGNTLIVSPNAESTHGTLTARFDFDIDNAAGNWNGGHSGVDVTDPTLNLLYTTLSETTNTVVKFCWEFTPSTCPQAVEDIANTIVDIEEDLENIIYDIETPILEFNLPIMTYEPELIEVDEPKIKIEILSIPIEMSIIEEVPLEQITTEEIIDAYNIDPNVETQPEIETTNETIIIEENINEVPEEQMAMVEETTEPIQEQPIEQEEVVEKEIVQQESTETEKEVEVVQEEESNSENVVADKSIQKTNNTKQEEAIETETQENNSVDVKIAKIEKYIENNVKNAVQKAEATLAVVSELVSKEMKSNQVDISSYDNINQAIFDNRQLPDGNAEFFNQVALVGYDKTIYNNQVSLSANDPVVKHTIKLNNARSETNKKFNELRELINERNNI